MDPDSYVARRILGKEPKYGSMNSTRASTVACMARPWRSGTAHVVAFPALMTALL